MSVYFRMSNSQRPNYHTSTLSPNQTRPPHCSKADMVNLYAKFMCVCGGGGRGQSKESSAKVSGKDDLNFLR